MAKTTVPIELSSTPSIVDNGNATAITIDSSENVGIGTSPDSSAKLDILTGASSRVLVRERSSRLYIDSVNETNSAFDTLGINGSEVIFEISGTEKMRINSSGNVGIGTTSPASILHTTGSTGITLGAVSGDTWQTAAIKPIDEGSSYKGTLAFYTHPTAGSAGFPTERMRIDSSGNVGIGTSSPAAALHVNGDNIANTFKLIANTSVSGSDATIFRPADNTMAFSTNGSERMRIDSSGNVLVGTTTYYPGVSGLGGNIKGMMSENGGTLFLSRVDSNPVLYINRGGNDGDAVRFAKDAGTTVGSISVTASATAYNTSSDYRLKENVEYDWDATTRLKQLKPARFNFIADADTTVDGFLAHEVSSIVPEAILGEKDEVDAEGNAVYQGIDQSKLVPLLVKTIQELEARITALEGN